MIHCMLASHKALLPLVKALNLRAKLFDIPGHGRSGAWDGKADYQGLTTSYAASLCDGPTHLIGHSFGATAALRLAVERPDLVNRLTLIEPVYFAAAKGTQAHTDHVKQLRPFVLALLDGNETRAAEMFNDRWSEDAWATIPAKIQTRLTKRIYLVAASGTALEEDPDGITSAERLKQLTMPVRLIRGEVSPPIIAAIHAALADRIPQATDHEVKTAGHMLPMTHTEEVAAIIQAGDPETA